MELRSNDIKVEFLINEEIGSLDTGISNRCLLYSHFLFMTRGKLVLEDNEVAPRFCNTFFNLTLCNSDIKQYLTINDLNSFNFNWVKSIKVSSLSPEIINRLRSGIAGTRLFYIFKDYTIDNDDDSNLVLISQYIKIIADNGLFYEQHTAFSPRQLRNISMSRNLQNLILEVYQDDTIKLMVKRKSLYNYPIKDSTATQYKTWKKDIIDLYKTKLIDDQDNINQIKIKVIFILKKKKLPKVINENNVKIINDQPIHTTYNIRFNKPDLLIIDKNKNEITIIDIAVTNSERLKLVEIEKIQK